jgi:hypothetical protein
MSPTRSVTLPDELYERASREAQAEGKTTDEVICDALTAYLSLRQLDRLHGYGRQRALELGVTEGRCPSDDLGDSGRVSPVTITIEVPAPLSGQPTVELAARARLLLIIDEVRAGRLTRAAAARALDMALDDFLVEAGRHGLYAIDHDVDDFTRELDIIDADPR